MLLNNFRIKMAIAKEKSGLRNFKIALDNYIWWGGVE
jgi:hypothetical protein